MPAGMGGHGTSTSYIMVVKFLNYIINIIQPPLYMLTEIGPENKFISAFARSTSGQRLTLRMY